MALDLSIIIPHRGSALGLWATIHSCENDLSGSTLAYEYVVVTNGEEVDLDTKNCLTHLAPTGRLRHLHSDLALSPPIARQRASAAAQGRLLCFLDNHCLVGKNYFARVVANFAARSIDALHAATQFHSGDGTHYHYRLSLEYNFWAESSKLPAKALTPYRVAAAGHGGFVVPKAVWDEVGGYGSEGLFQGYAGEELAFDLKLWRYGKTVWLDPQLLHYHYAGSRAYSRHYTDEYYTNLMVCAHVIGGEKWLYRVYESFAGKKKHLRLGTVSNMYTLMETAYHRSAQHAAVVNSRSVRTLDEALVYFREQQIEM